MSVDIRLECTNDFRETEEVTREAFWNHFVPGCDEHFYLHNMRNHLDFIPELDFVAVCNNQIVGNIVYTKSIIVNPISNAVFKTITFGPISVHPAYQGRGIGSKLIKHSTDIAREMGFKAVAIFGDPRFYGRCGFRSGDKFDVTNEKGEFCVPLQK